MIGRKTIVCFAGGTAGDLVVGVLDPRNCSYDYDHGSINLEEDRYAMQKFWKFDDDIKKDAYLKEAFKSYDSLPSHDVDFHFKNKTNDVLGITCFDEDLRRKSARRFKSLHRPWIWESLRFVTDTETIEKYTNDILKISRKLKDRFNTIDLEDIIKGNLIKNLQSLGYEISDEGIKLYETWLKKRPNQINDWA